MGKHYVSDMWTYSKNFDGLRGFINDVEHSSRPQLNEIDLKDKMKEVVMYGCTLDQMDEKRAMDALSRENQTLRAELAASNVLQRDCAHMTEHAMLQEAELDQLRHELWCEKEEMMLEHTKLKQESAKILEEQYLKLQSNHSLRGRLKLQNACLAQLELRQVTFEEYRANLLEQRSLTF